MIDLSCLCGRIHLSVDERPAYLHECNCTLCRKTGGRWAYLHPSHVVVTGDTAGYRRSDKPDPAADIRFCPTCGVTTHWRLTESAVAQHGDAMMGVNMRLAAPADLAGIELRFPDGLGWSGEGAFDYVRPAEVIGDPAQDEG